MLLRTVYCTLHTLNCNRHFLSGALYTTCTTTSVLSISYPILSLSTNNIYSTFSLPTHSSLISQGKRDSCSHSYFHPHLSLELFTLDETVRDMVHMLIKRIQ